MSKMHIGLLICTILAPSAVLAADLPQQGTFKVTLFETEVPGKTTTLQTANGQIAAIKEHTFTYTNDAGSGFLHRATGRCLVSLTYSDASWHATGPCTYADPDGDLIFGTFDIGGTGNQTPSGTREYIGGTGKYAGLTGHATFTVIQLKTIDRDSPHVWEGHAQGTYKLAASTTQ
jgi:hypothetical protein